MNTSIEKSKTFRRILRVAVTTEAVNDQHLRDMLTNGAADLTENLEAGEIVFANAAARVRFENLLALAFKLA